MKEPRQKDEGGRTRAESEAFAVTAIARRGEPRVRPACVVPRRGEPRVRPACVVPRRGEPRVRPACVVRYRSGGRRQASPLRLAGLAGFLCAQLAFVLGVAPASQPASPFRYVDVFIDPHGQPLAAYQFELRPPKGVQLVGIEGGEHKAFASPPYYDPKALGDGERIVIAAFDTGAELPAGKTRVARLSVRVGDGQQAKPDYQVTLQVAASSDAKPIEGGTISVTEGVAQ